MQITVQSIMLAGMIAGFFGTIAIFTYMHYKNPTNKRNNSRWLFEKWEENVYDSLFKDDPNIIGLKVKINVQKYLHNCKLTKKKPNLKKIIVDRIFGIFIFVALAIIGIATNSLLLLFAGLIFAFPFVVLPTYFVDEKVKNKKEKMTNELPRFLDMLYTALIIDLPIEQAIEITSDNLSDTLIAKEFKLALADTKIGAYSWQKALENLASDYEIEQLSEFVADLVNSYNSGSSITESISRKSKDIKQGNLLTMKEKASKLTNTILLPILFFKIFPVLAILCIPIIQQLNSGGFGL